MRNSVRSRTTGAAAARLLSAARYEVLPTPTIEDKILEHVPTERVLTVTASPAKGLEETITLSERLVGRGYTVVPHLAARMVRDRAELAEMCARLQEAGVTRVFVPGGDAPEPGDYPDALSMLRDLHEVGHAFTHVGITGYPESHPTISDDLTVQAMWDKRQYATHIVSNLTFDSALIGTWVRRLRARGVMLPVLLGLPGPVDRTKLLAMATRIGVGDSTRFLAKHKGTMARLAAPGGFTGERFLAECAKAVGDPALLVEGLHVYTFNQVAETEAWRTDLLGRLAP